MTRQKYEQEERIELDLDQESDQESEKEDESVQEWKNTSREQNEQ
jgi:hypothetical protein